MVREGWALAYRRYSVDYVDEENEAHATRSGIWRGEFVLPCECGL
jgi:endonuclease YncB( thermonuclease family)